MKPPVPAEACDRSADLAPLGALIWRTAPRNAAGVHAPRGGLRSESMRSRVSTRWDRTPWRPLWLLIAAR